MKGILRRAAALFLAVALALSLTACAAPARNVSYFDLMSVMKRNYEGDINQVINAVHQSAWSVYNGRVWAYGYQTGGFSKIEEIETWIASVNTDGTDLAAMELVFSHLPPWKEKSSCWQPRTRISAIRSEKCCTVWCLTAPAQRGCC